MKDSLKNIFKLGILNITPDSFSDGGKYFESQAAIAQIQDLIKQGADYVELGADSTRPNSVCIGAKTEIKRLTPILHWLKQNQNIINKISIDTHHAEVADLALESGIKLVNDISAGHDPKMFLTVAKHNAKIVLMHSSCPAPHQFIDKKYINLIEQICEYLLNKSQEAINAGIKKENIILDPGLGAFISKNPDDSWQIIENFNQFAKLGFDLMLACSRKGFLKKENEVSIKERDLATAQISQKIVENLDQNHDLYIRVHNLNNYLTQRGQWTQR